MARNEVSRLTITIDIDKATGKITQFNQKIGEAERKVQSAGRAMQQTGTSASRMGDQAAAGAVGFQTMAQGMLNVTTSAAQTYTSFTNLASAEHRVATAHIGIARAQDLLNAKQLRLNELQERGQGNSQKAINLTKELQTATADLTAKEEKLRIEKSKLNDVYILFGVNLLNVAVSLGTTISAMKASRAASAALAVQQGRTAGATAALAFSTKVSLIPSLAGMRAALSMTTISTKGLGMAVKGLFAAMGPVGWAIIGVTTLFATWDMHLGKVFGSLEEVGRGIFGMSDALEEVETELNTTTDAVTGLDSSLKSTADTMKNQIPDGTKVMVAGLQNAIDKADSFQQKLSLIRTQAEILKSSGVLADFR
jgi:peptidoglycan hydrolase CwlO-like protein